jgi:hypothetical protein
MPEGWKGPCGLGRTGATQPSQLRTSRPNADEWQIIKLQTCCFGAAEIINTTLDRSEEHFKLEQREHQNTI